MCYYSSEKSPVFTLKHRKFFTRIVTHFLLKGGGNMILRIIQWYVHMMEELIDFLNENFCLNGYVWELNNNRLEYNE